MEILLSAICAVESGGEKDPNHCVGRDGLSFGSMQITQICLDDVNRITDGHYTKDDCAYPEISKFIAEVYINHYATKERLGHEPTDEDRARIWQAGPRGWQKNATLRYWRKVKAEMDKAK